jgi:hypothetical protein
MAQIWKDIPGYEGRYQASNDGQIRRLIDGFWITRILTQMKHPQGYRQVTLYTSGKETYKKCLVHRLVAITFLGPPPFEDAVVNHKDGDKQHNADTNLEWCTQGANVEHARRMRQNREARAAAKASQEEPIPW